MTTFWISYFVGGYLYYLWFWYRIGETGIQVKNLFWGILWSSWLPVMVVWDVGQLVHDHFQNIWNKRII